MKRSLRTTLVVLSVWLAAHAATAQTQGPRPPGAVVSDGMSMFGTAMWSNPANAEVSDDMYALAAAGGMPTQYLRATNFGFTIPGAAVIDGIMVNVERRSAAATVFDARVRIIKGGVIGTTDLSNPPSSKWPTMDAVASYGGNSELWGVTWTAADINSSAFGFVISANDGGVDTAAVDFISIKVFYSLCGDGIVGLSEQCDDGNTLNGDCCSSTCHFESMGSPCPDGNLCNGNETCNGAGVCLPGMPPNCDDNDDCTQDSCDPLQGCINATTPRMGCTAAQKGLLVYGDSTDNSKDKLIWKWVKGTASLADFGNPTGLPAGTTSYTLCLYAGTASALGGATVPPGSNWSALGSKGFKYKDPSGTADGIQKVLLKSNAQPNKSKILAKGKGVNLPDLPAMPFDSPVTVQLSNDSNSVCYESVFTNFKKNANGKFKAKLP
jgi:cysteine-rich repeat protein